jgi:hypothetical protein
MLKTPEAVVKTRKQRAPMSDEAKAIMAAKRKATIAAKKTKPILEKVVESLLDDREDEITIKGPEPCNEQERQLVFGLLIDIEDFAIMPERWLITQAGLEKEQALSYVKEYLSNKENLKKKYEQKPVDIHDLNKLCQRLGEFYKVCPHYAGY